MGPHVDHVDDSMPEETSIDMFGHVDSSSNVVCPWLGCLRHDNARTNSIAMDKGKKKIEGVGIIGYKSSSLESMDGELGI